MKKTVSIILALLLLASLGTAALAAGTPETYKEMGFTLTYPEEFETMKGVVEPFPFGRELCIRYGQDRCPEYRNASSVLPERDVRTAQTVFRRSVFLCRIRSTTH